MIQESCSSRGGQLGTVLGACKNMTGPVHRNSIHPGQAGNLHTDIWSGGWNLS